MEPSLVSVVVPVFNEIDGLDATLTHKSRTGTGVYESDDVFKYRAVEPEDDR